MDEEFPLGAYIGRALAVLLGMVGGFFLIYLLVAITAGARKGEPLEVNPKYVAASAAEATPAAAVLPEVKTGEEIFLVRCAVCHGDKGGGDGPFAPLLTSAPRDLVKGPYWVRSTPLGSAPTPEDLLRVIERGVPGTAMPGFEHALKREKGEELSGVEKVIAYLRERSAYLKNPGKPIPMEEQAEGLDWEVEAGKAVYDNLKCARCHGEEGRGDGPEAAALKDARGLPLQVTDLTAPWTFRLGPETHNIWLALEAGLEPKHMPSLAEKTSKGDRLALAIYVAKQGRSFLDAKAMREARKQRGPERVGEELVNLMSCQWCHTPRDARGLPDAERAFAGGVRLSTPSGEFYAGNITPDKKTGIGSLSDEQLIAVLKQGESSDGRRIDPHAMPWTWYSKLTTTDASAIVAFLKTLEPLRHEVPRGESSSVGMFGRLAIMFGGGQSAIEVRPKAGEASAGEASAGEADEDGEEEDDEGGDAEDEADEDEGDDGAKPDEDEDDAPAANEDDDAPPADQPDEDEDEVAESPDARMAAAKARLEEAKSRLDEAASAYARAKAEYETAKAVAGDKGKKKKKKRKKKRRKKKRRR
jgi:mono/diheme cytochrome c family protein